MKFRQHIDKHRLLYIIGILIAFSVGNLIGRSFYHTNDIGPSSNSAAQQLYLAYLQQKIIRERREDKRKGKDVEEEENEEDDNDAEVINQKEKGAYVGGEKDKGAPTLSQKDKTKLDIVTIVNEPEKTHGDEKNKKSDPVRNKTFDGVDYRDENVDDNTETNGKENAEEKGKNDEMRKEHKIQGREDEPVTNKNGNAEDVDKNEDGGDKNAESESENKGTESESKNQIHQDRNINADEVDENEEEGGEKAKREDKHAQTEDTEEESESKNQIHQDKNKNADSVDENEEEGDEKAETEEKLGERANKNQEDENIKIEDKRKGDETEDSNQDKKISGESNAENESEQRKYNNKVNLFEHENKSEDNDEEEMTNIETKKAKHNNIFFAKIFPDLKMSKPIFKIIRKKNIQAKERDKIKKRVGERYVQKTRSVNDTVKGETDSPVDNNPVTNKNEGDDEEDDEFDVGDEENNEISYKTISILSKGYNQAMVLHKKCSRKYKNMKERKKLILITTFTKPQSKNLYSARKRTVEKMKARLMEILNTVQKNLNNQMFESVHIFTPTNDDADYLSKIDFSNSHKLILVAVNKTVTVKLILSYVTKCLKNKYVAMTKPDNLFGKGWENFDFNHLKTEKLLYAVTRHSSKTSCRYSKTQANCDRRDMYRKSNDVIVFHVHGSFSLKNLQKLRNATLYHDGIENTLMWTFKYDLGYTIINPCRVLFVHHEHCVPLHEEYSEFDFDDMTYVWPSKKLF